jgi:hypothetical protein
MTLYKIGVIGVILALAALTVALHSWLSIIAGGLAILVGLAYRRWLATNSTKDRK